MAKLVKENILPKPRVIGEVDVVLEVL